MQQQVQHATRQILLKLVSSYGRKMHHISQGMDKVFNSS